MKVVRSALWWAPMALLAGWAIVRTGGWERGPLIQLMAFTPYAAGLSLLMVLLALLGRRWRLAGVAVVVAGAMLAAVLPRAIPSSTTGPTQSATVRVLSSNVLGGSADVERLVSLVRERRVDVLVIQEFTDGFDKLLKTAGLEDLLPYTSKDPDTWGSGSSLYSRFPLTSPGIRRNPSGFAQAYGTLAVPGAGDLIVESAHPMSPGSLRALPDWRADLAAQPHSDPLGAPRVLVGDFNATLDHRALRDLITDGGYRDAADVMGQGLAGTWGPYGPGRLPPVTIDHVLLDPRLGLTDLDVLDIPGTDHRALYAEVIVP